MIIEFLICMIFLLVGMILIVKTIRTIFEIERLDRAIRRKLIELEALLEE